MSSTINKHPRLRHYPWHTDYINLASEFRPYVMFAHEANYKSASVNTDSFGLREQNDAAGRVINFRNLGDDPYDILIGGSSAFGVDATSDAHTISALLQKNRTTCLNWGIRGASNQQELLLFLFLKRFVPHIQNVVLFTGVNLCSLASLKNIVMYEDFGAIFSQQTHFRHLMEDYRKQSSDPDFEVRRFLNGTVGRAFERNKLLGIMARLFFSCKPLTRAKPPIHFEDKIRLQINLLENDLVTWKCLSREMGFKLHFILQPALHWTDKPLTTSEKECFEADIKIHPSTLKYANTPFYKGYADDLKNLYKRHQIDFHDSNQWLNGQEFCDKTLFTDVCHLTDEGNAAMATLMRAKLDWKIT